MRSTIPIGAGLGSSASIAVCIATAALRLNGLISAPGDRPAEDRKREADVINHWAFIGEMIMHGTPSGVDNTVATLGTYSHQHIRTSLRTKSQTKRCARPTPLAPAPMSRMELTPNRKRSPLQAPHPHAAPENNTNNHIPNPALTRRKYLPIPQHKRRSRKSGLLPQKAPEDDKPHPRRNRQPH